MSEADLHLRDALPVGTVVGDYELEAVLGHGGFSVVYRARHVEVGHTVALKEYLPIDLAVRDGGTVYPRSTECTPGYEDGRRRFLEEARRIVQFKDDPGVVGCLGYFRANGTAYIVLEHVEGMSLAELLRKREAAGRPLDESELRSLAQPLVETLLRLHRADVLHRDIKPSNILLRRSDAKPVLIDFGAAKQQTALHSKSTAPFTEGYAAIEQVGEGELGPWTDVYAFGAVIWRIVAGGQPPWRPPNPKRVELRASALLAGRPDPLPSATNLGSGRFSQGLLSAIDRSLTVSADKRPNNLDDLREAMAGDGQRGGSSEAEPRPMFVRDQGRRQKWPAAALIAGCVVLAILFVAWISDGPTGRVPTKTQRPEMDAGVPTTGPKDELDARVRKDLGGPVHQKDDESSRQNDGTGRAASKGTRAPVPDRDQGRGRDLADPTGRNADHSERELVRGNVLEPSANPPELDESVSTSPVAIPPPPVAKKAPPKRIRVGGNVAKAHLTRQVRPQYPPLARQARIQGTVKLSAVISKDGTIQKLDVLSGHPLLVPAALDAVRQWRYRPTLLNGEAVEVLTNIDVNFTLGMNLIQGPVGRYERPTPLTIR